MQISEERKRRRRKNTLWDNQLKHKTVWFACRSSDLEVAHNVGKSASDKNRPSTSWWWELLCVRPRAGRTGAEPTALPRRPDQRWGCGSLAGSLAPLGGCTPTVGSKAGPPATCLRPLESINPAVTSGEEPLCLEANKVRSRVNGALWGNCDGAVIKPAKGKKREKDERKDKEMFEEKRRKC